MRDQRGAASLELVILIPALIFIVSALVLGARLAQARDGIEAAAQAGARAASLELGPAKAQARGERVARFGVAGLPCAHADISVDTTGWGIVGKSGRVEVLVRCTLPISDLLLPGIPGNITIQTTGSAAVDTYRRR